MIPMPTKIFTIRLTIANAALACFTIALATLFSCEVTFAQSQSKTTSSKVETYLKKRDVNGNGSVEPEEMSENTKKYLAKAGFDVKKSVKIAKVVAKSEKAKSEKAKSEKAKAVKAEREVAKLKVPGFGVEKEGGSGVQTFNTLKGLSSNGSKAPKTYSRSVEDRTQQTLDRYDRNRDGILDPSETKDARWGSPKPSISDLNGDGRLSTNELKERYAAREKAKAESSSFRSSRSSSKDEQSFSSSRMKVTTSTGTRRSTQNTSRSKEADRSKYQKYAQSLIKTYDKDGDGKLNRTETSKMRRPPVGADKDENGLVSVDELVASLIDDKKDKSGSKKVERDYSQSNRTDSRIGNATGRRNRSRTSSSLGELDVNGDNQIQMHEFADEWDDEVVAEYYMKDKNKDGVITADEWSR